MQVKTNIRAGKQNRGGSSTDDNPGTESTESSTPVYVPPVSRCTGA